MLSRVCLAVVALCSLSLSLAQTSVPHPQVQVGSSPGANDVVRNGVVNPLFGSTNPWKEHLGVADTPAPGVKFYIWLSDPIAPATGDQWVVFHAGWTGGGIGDQGYVARVINSWNSDDWDAHTNISLADRANNDHYWFEFAPPTGDPFVDNMQPLLYTGCKTAVNQAVTGEFILQVGTSQYDNVHLPFTKQCWWPQMAFGNSNATLLTIEDLIAPSRTSNRPNLNPRNNTFIYLTPNNPTRSIVMGMQPLGTTWDSGKSSVYSIGASVSSSNEYEIDVQLAESSTGKVVCDTDAPGRPNLIQLTFTATCDNRAIDASANVLISVPVFVGFAHPWQLNVFNVTCGQPSQIDPMGVLKIDVMPSAQLDSQWAGYTVFDGVRVPSLWTPSGHLVTLGGQQQTMGFRFTYPSNNPDAVYSARIQSLAVREQGSSGGSVARMYNNVNNNIPQASVYTFPSSGTFSLMLDTTCWTPATTAVFEVLVTEPKRSVGANIATYNDIHLRFTWLCTLPRFSLSTSSNANDLVTLSRAVVGTPVAYRKVDEQLVNGANDTIVHTMMNGDKLSDVIYFSLQEVSNNHKFTWSIDPTTTTNLQDAEIVINGESLARANAARDYSFPWEASAVGDHVELEITRFTCKAKGSVKLVTWVRYGFRQKVQLIWERECTNVPDEWNPSTSSSLDDGAIFGIVVAVFVAVFCLIGIAYNAIKLGKSGLSVIPGVDSFNAWNDGASGPNRYSTDISSKPSKSKVADVEIHSLGYGSYQQSDDGYVDEIDTL